MDIVACTSVCVDCTEFVEPFCGVQRQEKKLALADCSPDFPWELVAEYFLLLCVWFEYSGKDYDQATYAFQTHNLIDSAHALSFWLPVLVGAVGLVLLLWCRPEQLPPLVSAGAVAGVLVGNIMQILLAVQIAEQVDLHRFFWIGISTFITAPSLLSAMGIRRHIAGQTKILRERQTVYRQRWLLRLYQFLEKTSHFRLTAFCWCTLRGSAGNSADSLRTRCRRHSSAFTQTAD